MAKGIKSASSQSQQPSGRDVAGAGKPISTSPDSRPDGRGTPAPSREMPGSRGVGSLSDTGAMHRLFDEGVDSGAKGATVRTALGATKKNPHFPGFDPERTTGRFLPGQGGPLGILGQARSAASAGLTRARERAGAAGVNIPASVPPSRRRSPEQIERKRANRAAAAARRRGF